MKKTVRELSVLMSLMGGLAVSGAGQAATIIDTTPSWTTSLSSGWDYAAQVFDVPMLDDYLVSLEIGVYSQSGAGGSYTLDIFDWDTTANHVAGSSLFSTGPHALPDGITTFVNHSIGLSLVSGGDYAAVISLLPDGGALPLSARGVAFVNDAYSGGYADWTNGPITSSWFWTEAGAQNDLAFRAEFDVGQVPIPAAAWLFGSGLLGLVGMARHKKAA